MHHAPTVLSLLNWALMHRHFHGLQQMYTCTYYSGQVIGNTSRSVLIITYLQRVSSLHSLTLCKLIMHVCRNHAFLCLLQDGRTFLSRASCQGRTDLVQVLLDHRADVNLPDDVSTITVSSLYMLRVAVMIAWPCTCCCVHTGWVGWHCSDIGMSWRTRCNSGSTNQQRGNC